VEIYYHKNTWFKGVTFLCT